MTTHDEHDEPDRKRKMDARLRVSLYAVVTAGALFTVAGFAVWSLRIGLSVAVGAAIATGNLYALARIVGSMMPQSETEQAKGGRGRWSLIALGKLLVLFGVVWFLIGRSLVEPLGLMAGFGALPIGIAIGSLLSDRSRPSNAG